MASTFSTANYNFIPAVCGADAESSPPLFTGSISSPMIQQPISITHPQQLASFFFLSGTSWFLCG
jgi:hypothetical protein